MTIEFVNHASQIFSHKGVRLITDPWIEGEVFQEGWSLLSETKFKYDDFKNITHIWFSHEHPDHFFPPNIKKISEDIRKNITILYHETNDKKVVNFCRKLNFKDVIEVKPNELLELEDDFSIINSPFSHDSWLYIKAGNYSFLNTNDCVINTENKAKKISEIIKDDIDVLLTQFSYACKYGNVDEPEKRIKAVEDKKNQISIQINAFKPKIFIPIASYVWFSHEENFYMNDKIHRIDEVEIFLRTKKIESVILYPGDSYIPFQKHNNKLSIEKYLKDFEKINIDNAKKTKSLTLEEVKVSAIELKKQLKREDFFLYILLSFFPLRVFLTDINKAVKFSTILGFREIKKSKDQVNLLMTTEVLNYCFKFNWGFGTTNVNARFTNVREKDMKLFNYYVSVADSLNHKDSSLKRVLKKIIRKFKS